MNQKWLLVVSGGWRWGVLRHGEAACDLTRSHQCKLDVDPVTEGEAGRPAQSYNASPFPSTALPLLPLKPARIGAVV